MNIKEKHYGSDHPETAKTMGNLANVHGSLGDYKQQIILFLKVLKIKQKLYGPDHPETLSIINNLGLAYAHAYGPILGHY